MLSLFYLPSLAVAVELDVLLVKGLEGPFELVEVQRGHFPAIANHSRDAPWSTAVRIVFVFRGSKQPNSDLVVYNDMAPA